MLAIILKLSKFLKESNKIAEYEEIGGLFVKWSFYFNGRSYLEEPVFQMEKELSGFYEKYLMEEMNNLQAEDAKIVSK